MSFSEIQILKALSFVIEPDLKKDIIELGLVTNIQSVMSTSMTDYCTYIHVAVMVVMSKETKCRIVGRGFASLFDDPNGPFPKSQHGR